MEICRTSIICGSSPTSFSGGQRGACPFMCNCSIVATNLIDQLEKKSRFKGGQKLVANHILKAVSKPIVRPLQDAELGLPVCSRNTVPLDQHCYRGLPNGGKYHDKEKEKLVKTIAAVLEKADKLEDSSRRPNGIPERELPPYLASIRASKRCVWRKGDPCGNIKDVANSQARYADTLTKQQSEKAKRDFHTSLRPISFPQTSPSMVGVNTSPVWPLVKKHVIVKELEGTPSSSGTEGLNKDLITEDKLTSRDKIAPSKLSDYQFFKHPLYKHVKGSDQLKTKDEHQKKVGYKRDLKRLLVNGSVNPYKKESKPDILFPGAQKHKHRKNTRAAKLQAAQVSAPVKSEILEVGEEGMTIEELSFNLAVGEAKILKYLFFKGIKPDTVHTLNKDLVKMICKGYGVEVIEACPARLEDMAKKRKVLDEQDIGRLESRPPVFTIMGHVDHGKTTLLDCIRKSRVAPSEVGGITQGIGAYKVLIPVDSRLQPCVFFDTPGHEAFAAMRARGARVTDIAVIVVAADEGVCSQTHEAITHAKAAGIPFVIAINKIDKDGSNPQRVMEELSSVGLVSEDWGGNVPMVQISALTGENVDDLLETIMLLAELQELKANPQRYAKGAVVEACLHRSKGPLATLIVQNGTLRQGDIVVCGESCGKVRAMFDDGGCHIDEAGPSVAVQVIGLKKVPIAGDEFEVVASLDVARKKVETCAEALRDKRLSAKAAEQNITISSVAFAVSSGKKMGLDSHQLNIILKVDVQGSIEAIRQALQVLPQDNVILKFLLQAPGDITPSDVDLAFTAKAIVCGFNVKILASVKSLANRKAVDIRMYRVIYELVDDVRDAMEGLLVPVEEEIPMGSAEVRAVFRAGSSRAAGCMVTEGKLVEGCRIKVIRKGRTVHIGILNSLRRVKEIVKEVLSGLECGIGVEDYSKWEVGDIIQSFATMKKKLSLEEASAAVAAALAEAGLPLRG